MKILYKNARNVRVVLLRKNSTVFVLKTTNAIYLIHSAEGYRTEGPQPQPSLSHILVLEHHYLQRVIFMAKSMICDLLPNHR